jgi:hypothetical protein
LILHILACVKSNLKSSPLIFLSHSSFLNKTLQKISNILLDSRDSVKQRESLLTENLNLGDELDAVDANQWYTATIMKLNATEVDYKWEEIFLPITEMKKNKEIAHIAIHCPGKK